VGVRTRGILAASSRPRHTTATRHVSPETRAGVSTCQKDKKMIMSINIVKIKMKEIKINKNKYVNK
jgi:hypothetical protein